MQEQLANLVHHVFNCGLNLRDRLEKGEKSNLEAEQTLLRSLLLTDMEAQRWPEFGGDEPKRRSTLADDTGQPPPTFLGVRYALTCWLDELFILYSPWSEEWNERKLEVALYGSNDRAWRFWEQASFAERRPTTDAMEVFYLCVMLGFRGELRESADMLQGWVSTIQARVSPRGASDWPHPPELDPPTNVPPLRGRDSLQRVVWLCGAVLLVLIPIVAFFVVQQMGQ